MKFIIAIILSISGMAVHAQSLSPAAVAGECARQMQAGICTVRPDRSTLKPGDQMVIPGVGAVSYAAYHDYMDRFNEANPTDTSMCNLALEKMTTAPGGDHDLIARALWTPNDMETMETYLARQASERKASVTQFRALELVVVGLMVFGALIRIRRWFGKSPSTT